MRIRIHSPACSLPIVFKQNKVKKLYSMSITNTNLVLVGAEVPFLSGSGQHWRLRLHTQHWTIPDQSIKFLFSDLGLSSSLAPSAAAQRAPTLAARCSSCPCWAHIASQWDWRLYCLQMANGCVYSIKMVAKNHHTKN